VLIPQNYFTQFIRLSNPPKSKNKKTLLTELIAPSQVEDTEEVPLENPIEVDPSLILMTQKYSNASTQPLFTHNYQIKNTLALLMMDNGSQKNLVSQALVNHLNLVTTPHPQPYQLGWVQKDGPRLLVSKRCLVTFSIGQFKDIVLCDVSPLDCWICCSVSHTKPKEMLSI
jgi:hypothetical protein